MYAVRGSIHYVDKLMVMTKTAVRPEFTTKIFTLDLGIGLFDYSKINQMKGCAGMIQSSVKSMK